MRLKLVSFWPIFNYAHIVGQGIQVPPQAELISIKATDIGQYFTTLQERTFCIVIHQ